MNIKYKKKVSITLLSILFLIVPIIILGLWIYVFENNPNAAQTDKVKIYHAYLPGFLHTNFNLSLVVLISSVIAIVFAAKSMTQTSSILKAINIITIIVGSLIMLLQLFSMM